MAGEKDGGVPKASFDQTLPRPRHAAESEAGAIFGGQSRGGKANGKGTEKPRRTPRKSLPAAGRDTFGSRKYTVRDKYHKRLMLEAINRNTSPSVVLDDLLSKLPPHRIQTAKPGDDQATDSE